MPLLPIFVALFGIGNAVTPCTTGTVYDDYCRQNQAVIAPLDQGWYDANTND